MCVNKNKNNNIENKSYKPVNLGSFANSVGIVPRKLALVTALKLTLLLFYKNHNEFKMKILLYNIYYCSYNETIYPKSLHIIGDGNDVAQSDDAFVFFKVQVDDTS